MDASYAIIKTAVEAAQGDGPSALAAYRRGLAIRDALAARDSANVQWQIDVAVSCAKFGTHTGLTEHERRNYLGVVWRFSKN
ncbi:MAG: hypothetical protein ACXW37_10260 [Nitrospira sp.]